MGAVFGKISVDLPPHTVIHATDNYTVWRYGPSVAATVRASDLPPPAPVGSNFDSVAFRTLARYIGVFSTPQNNAPAPAQDNNAAQPAPEKIAMTAPVVLSPTSQQTQPERIAMTAPVVLSPASQQTDPEKIAMTAPVVLSPDSQSGSDSLSPSAQSMSFLLPSKYQSVADAPVPDNPAITLSLAPAGRCEAVLLYSGFLDMHDAPRRAQTLLDALAEDNVRVTGPWTVHGYNSPFVLPWCRRNEIHVPVDPDSIHQLNPPAED